MSVTPRLGLTKPAVASVGWGLDVDGDLDLIDAAVEILSNKNATNGYAGLSGGKLSTAVLPAGTGTGTTLVYSVSPTLTTPNIGVANGSSLTLSGAASIAGTLSVNSLKQVAGSSFVLADPNGVSHFFISSSAPYTNTFVNGNGAGVVFLGSAAKTSVDDVTGGIDLTEMSGTFGGAAGHAGLWANSITHFLAVKNNGGTAYNLVGDSTTQTLTGKTLTSPAISDPTITGTALVKRVRANQGTAIASGNFSAFTSFGSTAALSAISGTDTAGTVTITPNGTGITANANITLTFADGTYGTQPIVLTTRGDGNLPSVGWSVAGGASSLTFFFTGTPVAGTAYILNWMVVGR
jgi:hypothetical protein